MQLLYSYTTPDKECCAYSYKSSVNFIASTLGGLLAGNINKISIFANIGYKKLFLLSAIMILVAFFIRLFFLPRDKRVKADSSVIKEGLMNAITLLKSHERIRVFAIFLFIISIGGSAIWPYSNLILKNYYSLSNTLISIINFIITTLNMISLTVMPNIIEKFGIKKFEIFALIALIINTFALSLGFPTILFIIVLIGRGASACLVGSSLDSSMMSHIELENRDVFAGVKLLVNGIACSMGNFIGGFIIDKISYKGIYIYGSFIIIIVIGFFYLKVTKYLNSEAVNILKVNRNCSCSNCKCRFKNQYIHNRK